MATYFSLNKTTGSGNGNFTVAPLSSFVGRGPVSQTVLVQSTDDTSVQGSVVCTKVGPHTAPIYETFTLANSATGSFGSSGITVSNQKIDIPNTASFIKASSRLKANSKYIFTGNAATYVAVSIDGKWIGANGTLVDSQTDIISLVKTNGYVAVPNDPGVETTFNVTIVLGFSANTMAATKTFTVTLGGIGTDTAADKLTADFTVTQAAAAPTMSVSPTTLNWGKDENEAKTVTVTSNDDWTVKLS